MVRDQIMGAAELEQRQLSQKLALARNHVWQDDIESGDAIGRDNQKMVIIYGVDIAHLDAIMQGHRAD